MYLIFLFLIVLLLTINMAALGLLMRRWIGDYPLAKVVGILAFCLIMFFIEHFVGMGKISWLWPITTALSLFVVVRHRHEMLDDLWRSEMVLLGGFVYALSWRLAFPDIDGSTEGLSDLSFVSNYQRGLTLPPP